MALISILAFIAGGMVLGRAILAWLDREQKLTFGESMATLAVAGFLILGMAILVLALLTHRLLGAIYGGTALALVGGLFFLRRARFTRDELLFRPRRVPLHLHNVLVGALFCFVLLMMFQVLLFDAKGFPQGVLVGWGDIAYHFDIIGVLSRDNPFTLEHPIAAGQPLTYPFLVDFFSAILQRLGSSPWFSFYFPMMLFGGAAFFLLYFVGKRFLKKDHLAVAFLFLVLLGGGLGFLWMFQDLSVAYHQGGVGFAWQTLLNPPHEYTHLDTRTGGKPSSADLPINIVWMVPMVSFFAHQRSFALGTALALLIMLGWIINEKDNEGRVGSRGFERWLMFLGLLPLAHTHTFFAASVLVGTLFLFKLRRGFSAAWPWILGGAVAVVLALPQVYYLSHAGFLGENAGHAFFRPWFGWMTCTHQHSWISCDPNVAGTDQSSLWFWTKNFGIVFWGWILALIIFFVRRRDPKHFPQPFIFASILLFILPNVVLFQPWEFDNNKVLFYWWILAVLVMIAAFGEVEHLMSRHVAALFLGSILVLGGLAGTEDAVVRIKRGLLPHPAGTIGETHFGYYAEAEREAARWIRENTQSSDAFLTADGANNFVPMLTGRPIFLGFPGWLWTQGRNALIEERKAMIARFFATSDPGELCANRVRWLIWEPPLLETYPMARNLDIARVGKVAFSQDIPSGQRSIVQLQCSR